LGKKLCNLPSSLRDGKQNFQEHNLVKPFLPLISFCSGPVEIDWSFKVSLDAYCLAVGDFGPMRDPGMCVCLSLLPLRAADLLQMGVLIEVVQLSCVSLHFRE